MGQHGLPKEHKEILGPAALYENNKVPKVFRPLAEYLLEHIPLENGVAVLDVACGTGIVARLVAESLSTDGTIVGVDLSPGMIEVARANTPPEASITWHVGNVGDMPFIEDDTFDWVLCQMGFQYFQDKARALKEMYRVLKPTGRLAMTMWQSVTPQNHPWQWAEVDALSKHVSREAGEKSRTLGAFLDTDEAGLRALLVGAGFRNVTITNDVFLRQRGRLETFITEDDYLDLEPKIRAAVVSDIRAAMVPYQTESGTAVPYGMHFVQAEK